MVTVTLLPKQFLCASNPSSTDWPLTCGFYNNYIHNSSLFFNIKLFKLFISIECKYNKLQLGLRISSIGISKQKLCMTMSLYVYRKLTSKEGAPSFSRVEGFRLIPGKHRCLCSFPHRRVSRNSSKARMRLFMILDDSCNCKLFEASCSLTL